MEHNRDRMERLKRPCRTCGRKLMMSTPGYWEQIERTKKKLSKLFSGKNNPNFGVPMSEEQKKKLRRNAKVLKGKDNYSYGKSVYDWWLEKYGKDIADEKMVATKKKWSISSSGEKNPMYGKPSPNGSGNGWSGWYSGWFFRSIHELSYMINVIEKNGHQWESAEQKKYAIPYVDWKGNQRTYFADFIIDGNLMIECKPIRLHKSAMVQSKQQGALKFCSEKGLTYRIECPILLSDDEIKKLHRENSIQFLPRYEEKFAKKYGT